MEEEHVGSPNLVGKPKKGKSLVMRRSSMHEEVVEEPPQRKSLFKTRCKSEGNVCKVIIDSGSTDNLV